MKKNLKSFFKGFSLVELMISLITISLISAAFAPIITKKLSSMGITVGSFGGNGNNSGGTTPTGCTSDMTCQKGYYLDEDCVCQKCNLVYCNKCNSKGNSCLECDSEHTNVNGKCVSQACDAAHNQDENGNKLAAGVASPGCCEAVGAVYVPASVTGTTSLCVSKFNPGDEKYIVAGEKVDLEYHKIGVAMLPSGTACTKNDNTCCWKGVTAGSGAVSLNGNDKYPPAERAVCQYEAARKVCNNLHPGESFAGSWRLLTESEAANMKTNTTDIVSFVNELQLCSSSDDRTKGVEYYCPTSKSDYCNGAFIAEINTGSWQMKYGACAPYRTWLYGGVKALNMGSGTISVTSKNFYGGTYGEKGPDKVLQSHPYGVRCATENIYGNDTQLTDEAELTTNDSAEPKSQADCPNGTLYINRRYTGGNKNLCMSQYNIGDGVTKNTSIDNLNYSNLQIKFLPAGEKCTKSDNTCCWKGTISSATTNTEYSNYSASYRTLCQYAAAEKLCNNWKPEIEKNGKKYQYTMRLMTVAEATNFIKYLNSDTKDYHYFSRYLDGAGLQFCSSSNVDGLNYCPVSKSNYCNGAFIAEINTGGSWQMKYGACAPHRIWLDVGEKALNMSGETFSIASDNFYGGTYGEKGPNKVLKSHPYGVRCVGEKYAEIKTIREDCTSDEPCNQSECPSGTLFIDKQFINAQKNICMTKYNFADSDANDTNNKPRIGNNTPAEYEALGVDAKPADKVIMVESGEKCSNNYNTCCWRGMTSSGDLNNDYRNYSPDYRTLCQYQAAYNLCKNFQPKTEAGVKNYSWELLTVAKATELVKYLNSDTYFSHYFSRYLDSAGLQLCSNTSDGGMNKCPVSKSNYCNGAFIAEINAGSWQMKYGACAPHRIWLDVGEKALNMSGETFSIASDNFYGGTYGEKGPNKVLKSHPYGVRCVTKSQDAS